MQRSLVAVVRHFLFGAFFLLMRLIAPVIAGTVPALLAGCSSAPSRSILGSYFPTWMICVLVGMCLTIVVRGLLVKVGVADELPVPIVVYLAFTLAFSFALWLLWLG